MADQVKAGLTEEAALNCLKAIIEPAPLPQTFEKAAGESSAYRRVGSSDKAELQAADRDAEHGKGKPQ